MNQIYGKILGSLHVIRFPRQYKLIKYLVRRTLSLFTSIIHHGMDVETVIFATKACSAPQFHSPREKTLLQALYLSTRRILSTLESKPTLDILKNWMPVILKETRGD